MSTAKNRKAWKHFYPDGNGLAKPGYCLHHVDETMKNDNPERYNEWNVEDLVMVERKEHSKIHFLGKHAKKTPANIERIKKLIQGNIGRKLSEEHKMAIREGLKNYVVTDESRKKMSESQKRRFDSDNERIKSGAKKVEKLTLDGNHVDYYVSGTEAGRRNSISYSEICSCCRGERDSFKGFKWRYV